MTDEQYLNRLTRRWHSRTPECLGCSDFIWLSRSRNVGEGS